MAHKPGLENKKGDVESLIAKRTQISNANIQAAIKQMEKERDENIQKKIIGHLKSVQDNTNSGLTLLQGFRAKEKAAKNYLTALNAAEEQFYVDADFDAYNKAVRTAIQEFNKVETPYFDKW